ncbi:MAG TPA: Rpn family recombination-promoting nuclease/putative transposase [Blastocatellia bacterium]|nr:Rpn family recombination-promoting nuclease/putative transposase [Blastocatellia bacterium]
MAEITNPHDRFFKELLGQPEIAADFLMNYLPPEVVAALDLSAPEPVRDAFIDSELQQHFSDLLYRVRMREGTAAFVYVLFEHKSAPDSRVAFQLLRYLVRIWERSLKEGQDLLPPIYPIVFHHGTARWNVKQNFRSLVAVTDDSPLLRQVPEFEYYLLDLAAIDETELKGAPYLRAGLMLFRNIFSRELKRRLPEIFRQLGTEPEQSLVEHLRTLIAYLSHARDEIRPAEIRQTLEQTFIRQGGSMQSIVDEWIAEKVEGGRLKGIEEGRLRGIEEGRVEGLTSMTLRLLQKKLGSLPEVTQSQISALTAEQLEDLAVALLDFNSMSDLESWLQQRQHTN